MSNNNNSGFQQWWDDFWIDPHPNEVINNTIKEIAEKAWKAGAFDVLNSLAANGIEARGTGHQGIYNLEIEEKINKP